MAVKGQGGGRGSGAGKGGVRARGFGENRAERCEQASNAKMRRLRPCLNGRVSNENTECWLARHTFGCVSGQ